jgi:proton glutamate symport protein
MANKEPHSAKASFASFDAKFSVLGDLAGKLSFLIRTKLWLQIIVGMVSGIAVGLLVSPEGAALVSKQVAELITGWLVLPGHLFLALIQMIMLPLVVSSIVLGIAGAEDLDKLRKMGLRIAPYFVLSTTIAVLIGVALALLIAPGQYIDPQILTKALANGEAVVTAAPIETFSIRERIVELIPTNPLSAALDESMLQIVVFAILTGIALASIDTARAKPLLDIARAVQELAMKIVSWAMIIVPLAVLGLLAQITMQVGLNALVGMSVYVGVVLLGLILLLMGYSLIVFLVTGIKPSIFLSKIREVQLLAFSTSSSAAVMPLTINTAVEKFKVQASTADFIIPLGATINMDGTALYQVIAALFLTQVFGVDLSTGQLILLVATTVGASIGSPSTPGVGIVILATILANIGVPPSGIALIIGVDRILDMSRTAINVSGDITACLVMDKWLPSETVTLQTNDNE